MGDASFDPSFYTAVRALRALENGHLQLLALYGAQFWTEDRLLQMEASDGVISSPLHEPAQRGVLQ